MRVCYDRIHLAYVIFTHSYKVCSWCVCIPKNNCMLRFLRQGTYTGLRRVIHLLPHSDWNSPGSPYLRCLQLLHIFLMFAVTLHFLHTRYILAPSLFVSAILRVFMISPRSHPKKSMPRPYLPRPWLLALLLGDCYYQVVNICHIFSHDHS